MLNVAEEIFLAPLSIQAAANCCAIGRGVVGAVDVAKLISISDFSAPLGHGIPRKPAPFTGATALALLSA
jgi:hypothetical protein